MAKSRSTSATGNRITSTSRRDAIALMLGASRWLSAAPDENDASRPLRLAISKSLVTDVNLNDARAAFVVWMEHLSRDLRLPIEYNPFVFDTTQEILSRVRAGRVDAVAINVLEYVQIADLLDTSEVVVSDEEMQEQYVLLVKRDSGFQELADLQGRRLIVQNSPKMCVAPAWLSVLLAENELEQSEKFFGAIKGESKPARVVLPVFFGQIEACLVLRKGFAAMAELNPQLSQHMMQLAISPLMVATFYVFRKNCQNAHRENLIKALSTLGTTPSGRQLMTMFQFDGLAVKDASCLDSALRILEMSTRIGGQPGARYRKG